MSYSVGSSQSWDKEDTEKTEVFVCLRNKIGLCPDNRYLLDHIDEFWKSNYEKEYRMTEG